MQNVQLQESFQCNRKLIGDESLDALERAPQRVTLRPQQDPAETVVGSVERVPSHGTSCRAGSDVSHLVLATSPTRRRVRFADQIPEQAPMITERLKVTLMPPRNPAKVTIEARRFSETGSWIGRIRR